MPPASNSELRIKLSSAHSMSVHSAFDALFDQASSTKEVQESQIGQFFIVACDARRAPHLCRPA